MRWIAWLAALLLNLLPCHVVLANDPWAPFDTPWFERLSVSDGLPHSITTALAQDQRNLVWIGTMSGLVRYDGYRMQVFTASDSASGLPDAYVRNLLTLPDGSLLVGTNAGGLARFYPATNSFRHYPVGKGGTSDRKIYALAHDGDAGVWIASELGLDRLDLHTDRITPVPTDAGTSSRNFSVLQDRAGNLWLGNNNGLFVRFAGTKNFVRPRRPHGDVDAVLNDGIWTLHEDREGRLWVGSTRSGAVYRDADGHWQTVDGFSGYLPGQERRPTVRDILEVSSDTVWLGTDGDGVMSYTPGGHGVRPLAHDAAMPSSLPGDSVRALLQDQSGNVWVATDLGVARHTLNARTAFALLPSTQENRTLANTNVRGIFVDTRGRIWLGMSAGSIDMIDLDRAVIRHLQLGGNQTRRDVQAFAEAPDGTIWVGTQGLARISPDTLTLENSVLPALDDKPVLHLLTEGQQLLIGTYDGVYRYDLRTHALVHFEHDANDARSLGSNTVRRIAQIGNATWYVTSHGISIANDILQTRGFTNLINQSGDPQSLPNNLVSSVTDDPQGGLWVGTYGGVAMLEPRNAGEPYRFRTIGVAQGLSSQNVNAVQSDDQGNPWVSLPNGISMIDGNTHVVRNLSGRDGLRISSYVYAASARAPGGELLFGGLGGLTVIRPSWRPTDTPDPPLAITYATLNGLPLAFGKLPRPGETLRLGPHNRSLRVDFSLLDFQAPTETYYSYRMDDFDENWIEVPRGSLPSALYTNLPHGNYQLHLRAQTMGMQPRVFETVVGVTAEPRWYETVSAMIGGGVLLLALLIGVIQLRTLYLHRKARELQQQIDVHTRDLVSANRRLDELASTDGLTGLYNRRRFLELAEGVRQLADDGGACIALLDLDGFKQINDAYGHLAGDEVIRVCGQVMQAQSREGDLVGRYGGEEMVVCLTDGNLEQGLAMAERIRLALAASPIVYEGQRIAITASIGVAAWRTGETLSQWLSRADAALYEAKHAGRNRSVAAK
ncbi:ligand-binding sensor domain-containing diguanylate cyclase [Dyella sp. ASV21]|uniref:ligand-binding sensor domain-containing diguanylate cyclase n=1 Tax=Dyella sp. ASV21 TaxID=2795114 RepID=UPI0018EBD409|nr:ligand-binding sensor domain-containing diguanylate cyclase [Dyella sp. ASV21]